jgi:hypothetical protein
VSRVSLHLSPTLCYIAGYVGACCVTLGPSSPCSSKASPRQVGPSQTAAQDKPPHHRPRLVLSPAIGGHEGSQALHPPSSPPLHDDSR